MLRGRARRWRPGARRGLDLDTSRPGRQCSHLLLKCQVCSGGGVNLLDPRVPSAYRRGRGPRSRPALRAPAVKLVTERETTSITVSELADAADVSRRVVYQHYEDKDALLLDAALDLARRAAVERAQRIPGSGPEAARANV